MDDPMFRNDVDENVQAILLAASQHDIAQLRTLLHSEITNAANVQDSETGYTALHAAIAACAADERATITNGDLNHHDTDTDVEAACETVRLLLRQDAAWDALDRQDETPGCLARKLGLSPLYDLILDAGVRAMLLGSHLDQYEALQDDVDESSQQVTAQAPRDAPALDPTIAASVADSTVHAICPNPGQKTVLVVGNIQDAVVEALSSNTTNTIHVVTIEQDDRSDGHFVVHKGDWHDVLTTLIEQRLVFDALYFNDPKAGYSRLRAFAEGFAPSLLKDGSKWSFFNHYGSDRQIYYDVYSKVLEMDLMEAGFDLEWIEVPIGNDESVQIGTGWKTEAYRIPIMQLVD